MIYRNNVSLFSKLVHNLISDNLGIRKIHIIGGAFKSSDINSDKICPNFEGQKDC